MIYQVVLSRWWSYRFQMHPKLTEFKIYQAIRNSAVHRHEWERAKQEDRRRGKIWVKAFSLIVLQSFQDIAWPWRSQPPSAKVLKNNLRNIQRFRKGESFLRSLTKTSESVRIFSDTQMAKGIVGCTCLVLYSLEARSLVIFPLYHPKSHLQWSEIVSISYLIFAFQISSAKALNYGFS